MNRTEISQELCQIRLDLLNAKLRLKDLTKSPAWAQYAKEYTDINSLLQDITKSADDVSRIQENFTWPRIGFRKFRNREK